MELKITGVAVGPHVDVPTAPMILVGTPFKIRFCGGTISTYRSGTIRAVLLMVPAWMIGILMIDLSSSEERLDFEY
jgi:hypothetical protein